MSDLPMVCGDDVVRALVHAGFTIIESTGADILLERDWLLVLVPRSRSVEDLPLERILRSASVPPLTFYDHLAWVREHPEA